MSTADKVRDIIGVPDAETILGVYDEQAPQGKAARQMVAGMDALSRHGLALIELTHIAETQAEAQIRANGHLADLRREHDMRMRGEGIPCRDITNVKLLMWKVCALSISIPIGIGLAVVFLVWVSKKILFGGS